MPSGAGAGRSRTARRNWAALSLLAICGVASARDGVRRLLLDNDLRARVVEALAIDSAGVTVVDDRGSPGLIPAQAVAAILPLDSPPFGAGPSAGARLVPPAPGLSQRAHSGLLALADGARFPGQRAGAGDDPEKLLWRHPRFGRVAAPIDAVSWAIFDAGSSALRARAWGPSPDAQDRALLLNGDEISGLLIGAGEPMAIENDAGVVNLPGARVAAIALGNPPVNAKGMMVWLDDGTAAPISALAPERRQSADEPAASVLITLRDGQQAAYALESVRALVYEAQRITPLASIEPRSQTSVGDRPAFEPLRAGTDVRTDGNTGAPGGAALNETSDAAPLGAADLHFPGPMRVTWGLPAGSARFAARATLPADARPWGDCVLVVQVGGSEVFRARLNAESPAADFAVPVTGADLTITIEPGEHGPVNDRVTLRRAIVLRDTPTG